MTLRFSDDDAIRAALGVVPPDVQARGGHFWREDDAIVVQADLPAEVCKALVAAGISEVDPRDPNDGEAFLHWLALVPPVAEPDPDLREVLFLLPPGEGWIGLASELVRLGCDDQELLRLDQGDWLIKARNPPYYTVAKAADGAFVAFTRDGPDLWVEMGFHHEMAERVSAPDGTILLARRSGWRAIEATEWTPLDTRLELLAQPATTYTAEPPDEPLVVKLRLIPTPKAHRPSLWVVPPPVASRLESLLRTLPEATVEQLELARFIGEAEDHGALLRARPGTPPPILEGLDAFVPHPHLASLFVPWGMAIDPPLQARTIQRLLDPGSGRVAWVTPLDQGMSTHFVEEGAFQRLADHVLYVAETDEGALDAWMGNAAFEWEPLNLEVVGATERTPRSRRFTTESDRGPVVASTGPATPRPRTTPRTESAPATPAPRTFEVQLSEPGEIEQALQDLQAEWTENPDRTDLWAPMAMLHHRLDQPREAALCWTRALWDADAESRSQLIQQWAGELPQVDELPAEPDPTQLTAVVAHLLAENLESDPPEIQRWLDEHDPVLDVRSRWLARRRVAQLAGGDELALARARDDILASIRSGLMPVRDVPAFMRTSTTPEDRRRLAESLAGIEQGLLPLTPKTAPQACTRAYTRLTLAWANARLGIAEPAVQALGQAEEDLPAEDAIHMVLLGLYRAGIDEALRGLPEETPPPAAVQQQLSALAKFDRYKIDRLRNVSMGVLREPQAQNPFEAFVSEDRQELAALPPDALLPALNERLENLSEDRPDRDLKEILQGIVALDESDGARLLDRVLDQAQALPGLVAVPVLVEVVGVAAALRRPSAGEATLSRLAEGLAQAMDEDPTDIAQPAIQSLARHLARCGLMTQGRVLFAGLQERCPAEEQVLRLRLAGALAHVGGTVTDEAEAGLRLLEQPELPLPERLRLLSAVADLAAPMPLTNAIELWASIVPQARRVEDAYSTNTHFALSFLHVVEILAGAHVHPDRLLSAEGRSRLDADEHRVRLRIHQEGHL
ncbi:MAG: hypothetical protein AAGA48_29740 [Myxococcota bacterium]